MGIVGTIIGGILGAWLGGTIADNMREHSGEPEADPTPATASLANNLESPETRAIALAAAPQERFGFRNVTSIEALSAVAPPCHNLRPSIPYSAHYTSVINSSCPSPHNAQQLARALPNASL
jgi:hypothetical protein